MLKDHSRKRLLSYLGIIALTLVAGLTLKIFIIDAVCVPSASMESTLLPGDYIFVNKLIYGAKLPRKIPFSHASLPLFRFPSLKNIQRGDVIVFEFPQVAETRIDPLYFVKRCVGIAGDTIAIHDGNLFVNGKVFRQSHMTLIGENERYGPVVIPRVGSVVMVTDENYSVMESLIKIEGHTIERLPSSNFVIDGQPASTYKVMDKYFFVLGDNINHSSDSRNWGLLPEDNIVGQAMVVYWSVEAGKSLPRLTGLFSSIRWNRIGTFVY